MIRMDVPATIELAAVESGARGQRTGQADFGAWIGHKGGAASATASVSQQQIDAVGTQTPVVLEMTVIDAEGHSQSLILPWQLIAGPGLSWRFAGQMAVAPATVVVGGAATTTGAEGDGTGAAGRAPAPVAPGAAASAEALVLTVASRMPSAIQGSRLAATDASAGPARPDGIATFAARMIRCFEREGEGLAVRIRDYGLDETAERLALRLIRQELAEGGVRLSRVVINSKEVWRA